MPFFISRVSRGLAFVGGVRGITIQACGESGEHDGECIYPSALKAAPQDDKCGGRAFSEPTLEGGRYLCRPYGTRFYPLRLTQDLRPFGFAQGRLWAVVGRRFATGV